MGKLQFLLLISAFSPFFCQNDVHGYLDLKNSKIWVSSNNTTTILHRIKSSIPLKIDAESRGSRNERSFADFMNPAFSTFPALFTQYNSLPQFENQLSQIGRQFSHVFPWSQPNGISQPMEMRQPMGINQPMGISQPMGINQQMGTIQPMGTKQPMGISQPMEINQQMGTNQQIRMNQPMGISQPTGINQPMGISQPMGMNQPMGVYQPMTMMPINNAIMIGLPVLSGQQFPVNVQQTPSLSGNLPEGSPATNKISDLLHQKYNQLFSLSSPQAGALANSVPSLPDLSSIATKCPRDGFFYSFCPKHNEALMALKDILQGATSTDQKLDLASALQRSSDIHPTLWFYAFSSLCVRDPQLQRIHKMYPAEALPNLFISADVLKLAQNGRQTRRKRQGPSCITLDDTAGNDNGIENRLWYFRESIPVNAHHWYYHMMYPFSSQTRGDRHGELFYYMHASIVARYNSERLSNGLARVRPIVPLQKGTVIEAYNPHLHDGNSGQPWSKRTPGTPLDDILHQNDSNIRANIFIQTSILGARDRIFQAINQGFVTRNGSNERVSLQNVRGIDILGDLVQANRWSLNPTFYGFNSSGGLHNNGHLVIALLADAQYHLQLPPGVMADAAPAMRDVVFYRWHAFMNQIFEAHKRTLAPYAPVGGELPLLWPGVHVTSILVMSNGGRVNQLRTFWGQQQMRLNRGFDLNQMQNNETLSICAKQLDYQRYTYQITINKDPTVIGSSATVRIFMAPRFDEAGNRFAMTDQRTLFFVLDTFGVTLNPGVNNIFRRSTDSTLTIPWEQSLRELNGDTRLSTPYCGCGWPHNMLLPKGTSNGMVYDLFVMVTNGLEDAVQQTTAQTESCIAAPLYCGLANLLYPDAKPMGYPFDRLIYSKGERPVGTLEEYTSGISNMAITQVEIQFTGDVFRA